MISAPALQLLDDLRRQGVALRAVDGRLQYRTQAPLSPELLDRIRAHRDSLIAFIVTGSGTESRVHSHFHYAEDHMTYGDVCAGWSPAGWAHELRRKADCCDAYRPDIAHYYRAWAADIERRLDTPTGDNGHGSSAGSH